MDAAKMNQAIRIAKLYYELHYNQLEIAAREGISKSSVSRILKNAMDMGIIEVRIKDSVLANGNLENELIARFPIKRAIIVPDLVGNSQILMQDVCAALAEDLPRYIKNDSVIGVTWGHALAVLAQQLPKRGICDSVNWRIFQSNFRIGCFGCVEKVCRQCWRNRLSDSSAGNGGGIFDC